MTEIGGTKMGVPQLGPQKFKLFINLKNPQKLGPQKQKDSE